MPVYPGAFPFAAAFSTLTAAEFGWAIALAFAAAVATVVITDLARRSAGRHRQAAGGCCCRQPPWPSACSAIGSAEITTSQRTWRCSPDEDASQPPDQAGPHPGL